MKKPTSLMNLCVLGLIVGMVSLISCDFVFQSTSNDAEKQHQQIAENREEAKLLVEASKLNLTLVYLSKMEKEKDFHPEVKAMADSLSEEHMTISKQLDLLAEEQLISIPDTIYETQRLLKTKDIQPLSDKEYLEQLSVLLKKEISTLEQLSERTSDRSFKTMSIEAKSTLKDHLIEAERLLEKP